jgi:competence protein ComEC
VAFCLGIVLQAQLGGDLGPWAASAAAAFLVGGALAWIGRSRAARVAFLIAFAALGGQVMAAAGPGLPAHHVARLPEEWLRASVQLEGWVVVPPDPRPPEVRDLPDPERVRLVAEVTRLRLGDRWHPVTGRARLTLFAPSAPAYGDEVRGAFRLRHPRRFDTPGTFDYPTYLAAQGIFLEGFTQESVEIVPSDRGSVLLAAVFRLRGFLLERLDASLPPGQAALLKAAILGDRSALTPEMNQAFLDSGTYHILAISGLNVSLLAGTLFGLFRLLRLSGRVAAAAAALLVTLYALLAGAGPSVIRAAVMADVYLLAVVLDRRTELLNSLALAALGLLVWNPWGLFEVGFQLTFLATLGIVLVVAPVEPRLRRIPVLLRWIPASLIMTLAATALTAPVLAASFNRLSPVGLVANIPVVPLAGLITALGTATCAGFLVRPDGLAWLTGASGWLVDCLLQLVQWFAAWPASSVRVYTPTTGMAVAYYGGLACVVGGLWSIGKEGRRRTIAVCAGSATLCAAILAGQIGLRLAGLPAEPGVRLTMLDVGQGEAILLSLPGGRHVLVDAGSMGGPGFDIGQRVILPFLWHSWIGRLDLVVLTHEQADHANGVPTLLRNVPVEEVWTGSGAPHGPFSSWLQEDLAERRIPHRVVGAGTPPRWWGPAQIRVLHPPGPASSGEVAAAFPLRSNDRSLVLMVEWEGQRMLLPGDIGAAGEAVLLARREGISAEVLKVPHHGSRTGSGPDLLDAVRPGIAVLSVGGRNPFQHPHAETIARYAERGIRLFRTDRHGTITVRLTFEGIRASGRRPDAPDAEPTGRSLPGSSILPASSSFARSLR